MSSEHENRALSRLDLIHRQNNRFVEMLDRITDDVQNIKIRTTAVEEALTGVNRRLDRHEAVLDRIERRLELRETESLTHP